MERIVGRSAARRTFSAVVLGIVVLAVMALVCARPAAGEERSEPLVSWACLPLGADAPGLAPNNCQCHWVTETCESSVNQRYDMGPTYWTLDIYCGGDSYYYSGTDQWGGNCPSCWDCDPGPGGCGEHQ